jgi:glycosyltransferase involved in cell wall biosynthesis
MVKTILLLTTPMPFNKIGSWTTMYNYYLLTGNHHIDYIICPRPNSFLFENVNYSFVRKNNLMNKILAKLGLAHRLQNYFNAIDAIIQHNQKYIIQIVDNSGIVVPLNSHLRSNYEIDNFYVQYYYQGFAPLIRKHTEIDFFNAINEMFFLTELSYKSYLEFYDVFPCKALVLNNATISAQFYKLDNSAKTEQKQKLKIHKKLIFIWCSQDRPKKGLSLILDVWKIIYEKYQDEVELLVVGVDRIIQQNGVRVLGRVPNNELAIYYQISDIYLFPTLWKEGFGIALAEALKCGCYCIASDQGGVAEVLNFGKLGKLINNPNFIDEWVIAIETAISEIKDNQYNNPYYSSAVNELYDIDLWIEKMNTILISAKKSFNN